MGDSNIDINKDDAIGHHKLDVFCDTLNLTNLVKSETCYTNNHKSIIDLFLTNKPRSFQFTSVTETGLSDYHRLITTFIKSHFSNREFWKTMKPFLTNKGCLDNCDIMLRGGNKMITGDKRLAKPFNEHYINIVERSSGLKPEEIVCHN